MALTFSDVEVCSNNKNNIVTACTVLQMQPQQPTLFFGSCKCDKMIDRTPREGEKKMCTCFQITRKRKAKDADKHKVVTVIMQIITAFCLDALRKK
jgi:hypothetical protein